MFLFVTLLPAETVVSEFWHGREMVKCMEQRNGTAVPKQALRAYYRAAGEAGGAAAGR